MKNRLDYLDSIRGLAALLVVVSHIFETYIKHNPANYSKLVTLFELVEPGRIGVIVFFLTSGFVIPWSLKLNAEHALKNFVIRRFFRLYPAYWFSIIVAVIVGIGVGVNIISVEQTLMNFTMIQKFLGVESVIGAYWTLHLELVFYVLCAVLFTLGLLHKNHYLIMLTILFCLCSVGVAALRYYSQIKVPIIMPLGLAIMFYGALLRNYFIEKQTELTKPLIFLTVFYFSALLIADHFYYVDGWLKWFLTHVMAFSTFFLLVTKVKLHQAIAVYLGRVSYSLYLLHAMVIGVAFEVFGDFAYSGVGFVVTLITIIGASILCADLSYRFIEKPGVELARKITSKYKKVVETA